MTNRPESIARVTVIRNPKHGSPGPNMLQGLQQRDKDDVTIPDMLAAPCRTTAKPKVKSLASMKP